MLRKTGILLLMPLLLASGCTAGPNADGDYAIALVGMSRLHLDGDTARMDLFYITKIDGKPVHIPDQAHDVHVDPGEILMREQSAQAIPAKPGVFTIYGRSYYDGPKLASGRKIYEISGDIHFTPRPGHYYRVQGALQDEGSSVWVVDESEAVMDKRIEAKGPSTR